MKTIRYILSLCLIALTVWTCADDEKNVDFANSATAPTNLAIQFDVTQDNTGLVTMLPTAEGAVSFDITFGDKHTRTLCLLKMGKVYHTTMGKAHILFLHLLLA